MPRERSPYGRGGNPNSLANLVSKPGVRNRMFRVTDEQWEQLRAIALELGISKRDGVSGMLQAIGDGRLKVVRNDEESIDDHPQKS